MPDVLAALAPHVVPERHLIVSIAAGAFELFSMMLMAAWLPAHFPNNSPHPKQNKKNSKKKA